MCCFCASFRGGAYFGATTQMLLGIALFIRYIYVLAAAEISIDDTKSISTISIFLTYGLLLFGFGAFIFRGIEKDSLQSLKVSVGGFLFLQSIILLVHFILIVVSYEDMNESEKKLNISILVFNLIFSFIHLSTMFMYMVRLAQKDIFDPTHFKHNLHSSPSFRNGHIHDHTNHYHNTASTVAGTNTTANASVCYPVQYSSRDIYRLAHHTKLGLSGPDSYQSSKAQSHYAPAPTNQKNQLNYNSSASSSNSSTSNQNVGLLSTLPQNINNSTNPGLIKNISENVYSKARYVPGFAQHYTDGRWEDLRSPHLI